MLDCCPCRLLASQAPDRNSSPDGADWRDRQLVVQEITERTRPKYPSICPKWTERGPCVARSRVESTDARTTVLCGSTLGGAYDLTAKSPSPDDPYCGGVFVPTRTETTLRGVLVISEFAHASVSSILRVAQPRPYRFHSR